IVRDDSVDLDNVSGALSETLEVDYNNDPEPEPEPDVDKSALEKLVEDAANEYDEDDYTEDSFSAFSTALSEAQGVLEADVDQEEVDAAVENLEDAVEGLEKASEPDPEPEVDTSKLKEDLKNAKKHDADDYTDESFGALSEAIKNAEALLEDENADQDAVDEAVENLDNAIEGLKEVSKEEPEEDTEEDPKEEPEENPEEETDSGVNKDDLQEFVEN